MTEQSFDHERLDVYRLSVEYVAASFDASESPKGRHRHARDQWLRAAQSIPLNIAQGNSKRSRRDRARFLDIAHGSALECAAIQDVLLATKGIKVQDNATMKAMLQRIVAMLTRMAMKFDEVAEPGTACNTGFDYEYEHRFAEHEHEHEHEVGTEKTPEPSHRDSGPVTWDPSIHHSCMRVRTRRFNEDEQVRSTSSLDFEHSLIG